MGWDLKDDRIFELLNLNYIVMIGCCFKEKEV